MERFPIYKNIFFGSLVVFILFSWGGFIDSIILILFIGSTFYLLFRRESKSEDYQDQIDYKEVHYYQTLRHNVYSYTAVITVILSSFLFYLLQLTTHARLGIISLIVWLVIVIIIRQIDKKVNENLFIRLIADYIEKELHEDKDRLMLFVRELVEKDIFDPENVESFLNEKTDWPTDIRRRFIERYVEYVKFLENITPDDVLSEEIEEVNSY